MAIAVTAEQRAWAESVGSGAVGELCSVALPEELGGAGGTVTDLAVGLEAAAAALAPGPLFGTVLAGLVLAREPDSTPAKELVPALADGSARAAVAFGPGSVIATPTEDGFRVCGRTDPVLDADSAAHLVLAADSAGETVWFVLPPRSVETAEGFDLTREVGFLVLDEEVPRSAVLAGPPVAELAATLAAAEAAGIAGWCVRTASEYAKVREQFGKPIGSFQAVKHLCAEMLCRAELAAALAWDAAEAGGAHPLASAVAAAGALDAAVDNAKDCIQVLGGIGFTWEHDAHRYLRRAVTLRQLLGGSGRWRRRAAELALAGERRELGLVVDSDPVVREEVAKIVASPERLAESGYLMPHWPRPYGLGADPARQLVIDAELRRAGVRRPDLVIGAWAVPTILEHGTDEQRARFAGPTLRGEITWCQLFSEPEAGSDLASLRTKATKVDGGWRLSGQKVWTSLAHEADWAICLARTDPEAPKHRGITYFLVDMTSPGIEIRPLREITGDVMFNEVFLDDVFVPDSDVVGEVHGGWRLARTTLANERVAMGSGTSVGEAVEELLSAVSSPDAAGLERLGALVVEGTACSLLDLRATLRRLAGQDPGAESSVRKLVGVRHRQAVAEAALDLRGPAGAVDAAAQHEFLLTRCLSIAGGTTQVLLTVAAERLLGLPR
ncbi:alkylation response protein AidB-like acyl-CoA dehydrogenase [Amycolatopsis bartoniae]|uniref:Acyl-CoA dehydrogenase n=1 Tax=Amycolatopsis bartoniae TaxID=941986 RepID=A0A8H9J2D8_9PSEU|nr:acyl-CoA dehydrogenase family protein [Amycolatopsis bartoniae]MBB2937643.1 alkylation response protein AidB-like acyl-CoA dehydrogenase [Amycolatopsis bartoniae]TVT00620.1 acyl-CoA dehydrogenase [Amycolatopsis bartoniae]GHF82766.1 acyl-CoA dehydrogenase [Amycolatopsis bartoniae]